MCPFPHYPRTLVLVSVRHASLHLIPGSPVWSPISALPGPHVPISASRATQSHTITSQRQCPHAHSYAFRDPGRGKRLRFITTELPHIHVQFLRREWIRHDIIMIISVRHPHPETDTAQFNWARGWLGHLHALRLGHICRVSMRTKRISESGIMVGRLFFL